MTIDVDQRRSNDGTIWYVLGDLVLVLGIELDRQAVVFGWGCERRLCWATLGDLEWIRSKG